MLPAFDEVEAYVAHVVLTAPVALGSYDELAVQQAPAALIAAPHYWLTFTLATNSLSFSRPRKVLLDQPEHSLHL